MAVSFVNAQQPRIDAWIQPGCRADIAVVSTESWPVDTVVTIGVADAAGVIAVPLLTITPDLATVTATVALTGVQVAALAVACPPPYGVIDWQWRTGAGSPLGVGSLHWDLTGARTTQTVTVMMGPAGPGATPEAISALVEDYLVAEVADPASAASLTLSSTYAPVITGTVGDGVTDDVAAINDFLTALGAGSARLRPGKNYFISAPIVLTSDQTLDATGCTITLKPDANCNMVRNYATVAQRTIADAAITTGQKTLTSATAAFTSADVGRTVTIESAGGNGVGLLTANITAVTNATTVTLSAPATATVAGAVCLIFNREHDIVVRGGTWVHATGVGNNTLHFRHVDGLTVDVQQIRSTLAGYGVGFGDVTNFTLSVRNFAGGGDGFHLIGPAKGGRIDYLGGTTADDMCALTCSHSTGNSDVAGDILNVSIGSVVGESTHATLLKLVAGAGRLLDGIKADHVAGTTPNGVVGNAVYIGDDVTSAAITGGTYGTIEISSVDAVCSDAVVRLASPSAERIKLNSVTVRSGSTAAVKVYGPSTATIGILEINGASVSSGQKLVMTAACPATTINDLILNGCRFTGANDMVSHASGTIGTLTFRDCTGSWPGGNFNFLFVQSGSGAITAVKVLGGSYVGGKGVYYGASGKPEVTVTLESCNLAGFTWATYAKSPLTVILNHPTFSGFTQEAFTVVGGTYVIKGALNVSGAVALLYRAATESVRVVGSGIPVDVSKLTPTNGDMAYNTNAGLAFGVGPVISDGTNWKRISDSITAAAAAALIAAQAATDAGLYDPADGNRLTSGEETLSRVSVLNASVSMSSGTLRLTYFTARKTETVNSLRIVGGSTAAGATPSLVRAGIWKVESNGDLTLVASIASDTSLLATASTAYTRALTAPLAKVAGQRYAYGLLVVTAATAPTVYGGGALLASEMGQAPLIGGAVTAQANLGNLTAAQVAASGTLMYAVLVP